MVNLQIKHKGMNPRKHPINTRVLYISLILFFAIKTTAQDEAFRIADKVSPESKINSAASGVTVDKYNGTLNVNIPLSIYNGREMDLPFSIGYAATGIKVDQLAGTVGLGWNLNGGGRMVRVVSGISDDFNYTTGCSGASYEENYPGSKDFYQIDAPGMSDLFRAQIHEYPIAVKGMGNEILERNGYGSTADYAIRSKDGTMYYFGQNNTKEVIHSLTRSYSNPNCPWIDAAYTTAWLLTKIVSKNGLDEYVFHYQNFNWANPVHNDGEGTFEPGYHGIITMIQQSSYKVNQQVLTEVWHNGEKIIGLNYAQRDDMAFVETGGTALSSIEYYDYKSLTPYKKIGFEYTYFGAANASTYLQKRLKLDKLVNYGYDKQNQSWVTGDAYRFSYIDEQNVPSIESYARDYLGLYNAQNSNANLLPYGPNNRKYNYQASLAGTLSRIIYPKGSYSSLQYEQNAFEGGYGHELVPQEPVWTTINLYSLSSDTNSYCEYGDVRYYEKHPGYNPSIDASEFGFSHAIFNDLHVGNAITNILDLSAETQTRTATLHTHGFGFYLIQTLDNCNSPSTPDCNNQSVNPCLRDTRTIFYTLNSIPAGYFKGGLIYETNPNSTIDLPPGKYQITVWDFLESEPNTITGLQLSIDTGISHIPDPVLVNLDHTYNYADGFRIRSITDYESSSIFAGKRLFKYSNVFTSDEINNVYSISMFPSSDREIHLSRGYANLPYIHFGSVFEIQSNESESDNNGYILESFGNGGSHGMLATASNYPFYYENDARYPVTIQYNDKSRYDLLYGRQFFTKNEKLLKQTFYEYHTYPYILAYDIGLEQAAVYGAITVPETISNTNYGVPGEAASAITAQTALSCNYYDGRLDQKTMSDGESIVYGYSHPILDFFTNPSNVASSTKGTVEMEYGTYPGILYNGSLFTRYLPAEIKKASRPLEPLETATQFLYDDQGNLVTKIQSTPGAITPASYETTLWGYGDHFPVAVISGLKYGDIQQAIITQIKTLSGMPVNPANEMALRNKLQELKVLYPDTMITTYTYNPVFGITSMTDPKGQTAIYEYDVFGRPSFTKKEDPVTHEQFIVSENTYHTRPSQP